MNHRDQVLHKLVDQADAAALVECFDLSPPTQLMETLLVIFECAERHNRSVSDLAMDLACDFNGHESRYPNTPTELFAIGSTGTDGVHYGFVVHDERLWTGDGPVGRHAPPDGEPVPIRAANYQTWLGQVLAESLDSVRSDGDFPNAPACEAIAAICERLQLELPEMPADPWDTPAYPADVFLKLPPGWIMHETADGLGVVGPAKLFNRNPPTWPHRKAPTEEWAALAQTEQRHGYALTALGLLRDCLFQNYVPWDHPVRSRMARIYDFLGRTRHAIVAERYVPSEHRIRFEGNPYG